MRKVTFSANDNLIAAAREKAHAQNKPLSQAFREWLAEYTEGNAVARVETLYGRLRYVDLSGGPQMSRDQMNER